MHKYTLIVILAFSVVQKGLACSCVPVSKKNVEEMYGYYEMIFIGTVVTGDSWNEYTLDRWNSNNEGSDVYMRIDSVIKGDLRVGQMIYIYQTSGGSCTEMFEYDSKKLVFGRAIKKLRVEKNEETSIDMDIPPPPLPYPGLREDGSYTISENQEIEKFLKFKLRHYTVIDTSMCGTFNKKSKACKEVLDWLKD
jgi:hypothetical protein